MEESVTQRLRIVVMDDHALFREGFAALLAREPDIEVVGQAADVPTVIDLCRRLEPDIVFLDIAAPPAGGIAALRTICQELPRTRAVMLTVSERHDHLLSALAAGASGYLLKTVDFDDLVRSVRQIAAGQIAISPAMTDKLVRHLQGNAAPANVTPVRTLSSREQEILEQVAMGKTNKEIARALSISEHTVRAHLRSMMDKLRVENRVQAAAYASRMLSVRQAS